MPDTGVLSLFYGKLFEVSITSILECTPYRGKSIMKAMTPELFGSSALSARALAATLCSLALAGGCIFGWIYNPNAAHYCQLDYFLERATGFNRTMTEEERITLCLQAEAPTT